MDWWRTTLGMLLAKVEILLPAWDSVLPTMAAAKRVR